MTVTTPLTGGRARSSSVGTDSFKISPSYSPLRPEQQPHHSYGATTAPLLPLHPPQEDTVQPLPFYRIIQYFVYATINVVIGVPGLYGYASVIFHHPVFQPHMNALSKLVLLSSFLHQLAFTLCSSLPFAIGMVQDAGLIFLSSMSTSVAEQLTEYYAAQHEEDHHLKERAILSTTIVLLSGGTACLGLVLVIMGKFKLANAVAYLPMPVVGGYLAFIGYFCFQAGVALCISQPMTQVQDWALLLQWPLLKLALPGLAAAAVFTYIARSPKYDAWLPLAMMAVPAAFYIVVCGITRVGLDGAREQGWVGPESPSVPVSELFHLVDWSLVHWSCVADLLLTWVGMVFVVSFASCLDVAAIAMDMGEALDTNKELVTVGIGNVLSGLGFGFTGSYIFSQTIFTYRTNVHSRWIGVLVMVAYLYIVTSPVNLLQVSPLFFLGSTLIFIGYDLLYEWLLLIRHKIFRSEYLIVWATFLAIQVVGMDAGIVLGILVSLVDHVVTSAKLVQVTRVSKKSRAVWSPLESKILNEQAYHSQSPKVIVLEISGTVFFGSSLQLFQRMLEETHLSFENDNAHHHPFHQPGWQSPHTNSTALTQIRSPKSPSGHHNGAPPSQHRVVFRPPQFIVLDLTQLSELDASACRGCFLQFVSICSKHNVLVCAAGPSQRTDWMLRSHNVCYSTFQEEEKLKAQCLQSHYTQQQSLCSTKIDKMLVFVTTLEALEFCETTLLQRAHRTTVLSPLQRRIQQGQTLTVASIFQLLLDATEEEEELLKLLESGRYHDEISFQAGDVVFAKDTHADAFYVVLQGSVAIVSTSSTHRRKSFRQPFPGTNAGSLITPTSPTTTTTTTTTPRMDPKLAANATSVWPTGGVFGFVDFWLQRPRVFQVVCCTQSPTICAKMTHSHWNLLQQENEALAALVQRVLLNASVADLANCTCSET